MGVRRLRCDYEGYHSSQQFLKCKTTGKIERRKSEKESEDALDSRKPAISRRRHRWMRLAIWVWIWISKSRHDSSWSDNGWHHRLLECGEPNRGLRPSEWIRMRAGGLLGSETRWRRSGVEAVEGVETSSCHVALWVSDLGSLKFYSCCEALNVEDLLVVAVVDSYGIEPHKGHRMEKIAKCCPRKDDFRYWGWEFIL